MTRDIIILGVGLTVGMVAGFTLVATFYDWSQPVADLMAESRRC